MLAGGLGPRTCARRSTPCVRGPSTRAPARPSRARRQAPRRAPRVGRGGARHEHEHRLRRVRRALRARDADPGARRARGGLGEPARGRRASAPSCTSCSRTTRAARRRSRSPSGSRPASALYLKREDLLHTGAHKLNNALGQAVLARGSASSGSSPRPAPGSTASRRRPSARASASSASSTWAARTCGGSAERRADAPARRRGAPGRVRHAHAEGGDERGDPRLDHERRDDALPDRLVRRPAPVPRDRPRAAARDRPRGARADARCRGPSARRRVACVGGGSNAIGMFYDFLPRGRPADRRRGGRGGVARRRAARCSARRALVGARGRRRPDPRRTLDLRRASTIPASARSTRSCGTAAAPTYVAAHRRGSARRRSTGSRGRRGSSRRSSRRTRSRARSTSRPI